MKRHSREKACIVTETGNNLENDKDLTGGTDNVDEMDDIVVVTRPSIAPPAPIINNIFDFLQSPWEDIEISVQ